MAQEELRELRYNPALQERYFESQKSEHFGRNVELEDFNYIIDTLPLPFFDDFTSDRIKRYNARKTDKNVIPRITYAFKIDSVGPDTFSARYDTTFDVHKFINGETTLTPTPALELIRYNISEGVAIDTDIVWTNIISKFDEASGLVTMETLGAEFAEFNTSDTVFDVADDNSLWVTSAENPGDRGAYINNTHAIDMPTQGVATLDGTDAIGFPYDISSIKTYGLADELASKPIFINSSMENVYLTFTYEAGGYGNGPDINDSLVVEFYSPLDGEWHHAWSTAGKKPDTTTFSPHIYLRIEGSKFKRPGFQFRFKNYATLSGSFDHWHIDYVRVDQDRDTNQKDAIFDVALLKGPVTYLTPYTAAPYDHYLKAWDQIQARTTEISIHNLSAESVFIQNANCVITDENGTEINSVVDQFPSLAGNTVLTPPFNLSPSQIFTDVGEQYTIFQGECSFSVTGASNSETVNDTLRERYIFYDYYAYDDGTAEKVYSMRGAGVKLAYRFETALADTLKAMLFNFPQTDHAENENLPMKLMVWSDLNSAPIYESEFNRDAQYTTMNDFVRFELEDPIVVSGTFYIGYQQIEATKISIGFDVNTNSSSNISYQIGKDWYTSDKEGSLMMRPDFGELYYPEGTIKVKSVSNSISVYPNPANDRFKLQVSGAASSGYIEIYTIDGSLVHSAYLQETQQDISVYGLNNGLYLLRFADDVSGRIYTSKLMIQKN